VIGARCNFESRAELAEALARAVSRVLTQVLDEKGTAVLAVSGGTTPGLFFEALSKVSLPWNKITITLVDERQVDESSPRSDAALVKKTLLQNKAAAARFVPLFENVVDASRLQLDVVVLGMGTDGHTASFFPGGNKLAQALDPTTAEAIIAIEAPGAGEPRLTYTLRHLLAAEVLFLHIEGKEKRTVLETAMAGSNVLEMPIRAVLQSSRPLNIFWCP
jgi:6-phosphogluconolactonase